MTFPKNKQPAIFESVATGTHKKVETVFDPIVIVVTGLVAVQYFLTLIRTILNEFKLPCLIERRNPSLFQGTILRRRNC